MNNENNKIKRTKEDIKLYNRMYYSEVRKYDKHYQQYMKQYLSEYRTNNRESTILKTPNIQNKRSKQDIRYYNKMYYIQVLKPEIKPIQGIVQLNYENLIIEI